MGNKRRADYFFSLRCRAATRCHTHTPHPNHVLLLPGHESPAERGPRQRIGQQVTKRSETRRSKKRRERAGRVRGFLRRPDRKRNGPWRPVLARQGPAEEALRHVSRVLLCGAEGVRGDTNGKEEAAKRPRAPPTPTSPSSHFPLSHFQPHSQPHLPAICRQIQRHDAGDGQEKCARGVPVWSSVGGGRRSRACLSHTQPASPHHTHTSSSHAISPSLANTTPPGAEKQAALGETAQGFAATFKAEVWRSIESEREGSIPLKRNGGSMGRVVVGSLSPLTHALTPRSLPHS